MQNKPIKRRGDAHPSAPGPKRLDLRLHDKAYEAHLKETCKGICREKYVEIVDFLFKHKDPPRLLEAIDLATTAVDRNEAARLLCHWQTQIETDYALKGPLSRHSKSLLCKQTDTGLKQIPFTSEIDTLLAAVHKDDTDMHLNDDDMLRVLSADLYWVSMTDDCRKVFKRCAYCAVDRLVCSAPYERFQVDLAHLPEYLSEGTDFAYMFNVVDYFSKYAWSFLIEDRDSQTTTDLFAKLLSTLDKQPQCVQHDDSEEFSGQFQAYLKERGIAQYISKPNTPQFHGSVQRFNSYMLSQLKRAHFFITYDNREWDLAKRHANFVTDKNQTTHTTTRHKPAEVLCTEDAKIIARVKSALKCARYRQADNKHTHRALIAARPISIKAGDAVALNSQIVKQRGRWKLRRTRSKSPAEYSIPAVVSEVSDTWCTVRVVASTDIPGLPHLTEVKVDYDVVKLISEEALMQLVEAANKRHNEGS
jgi:hypothetical protein